MALDPDSGFRTPRSGYAFSVALPLKEPDAKVYRQKHARIILDAKPLPLSIHGPVEDLIELFQEAEFALRDALAEYRERVEAEAESKSATID